MIDVLGTDPEVVPDIVRNNVEFEQMLSQIQFLAKRERKVVEMRFGLINGIRKTQREIARMYIQELCFKDRKKGAGEADQGFELDKKEGAKTVLFAPSFS